MRSGPLLAIVDSGDFRELFIRELGWNNPDRTPMSVSVEGVVYLLTQVAGFKGLRVWVCDRAPARRVQREIDLAVGRDSAERLLIFCGHGYQDWRWPRRPQTGGVNAKLMTYTHWIGKSDQDFEGRLRAIEIDINSETTLVELLTRMRAAFDRVIENESGKAARLMGGLYGALERSKLAENDSTLLLARLLFLLFGDDTHMWGPESSDLFKDYIDRHTTAGNLHLRLMEAFRIADTPHDHHRPVPGLASSHPLVALPYINGGLFSESMDLRPLHPEFRSLLLEACEFDWSLISPAIFGSMFQTVKDLTARRSLGEHYTTESNILRTIRPLFVDDLRNRLSDAWNDKGQLTRLLDDLRALRVLDPACGCGNFLVVAFRELRALELDALVRRRDLDFVDAKVTSSRGNLAQTTLDVTQHVGVTIDHFYGVEIEEWPARIAQTAMLLVDHLANQRMEEEFGAAPHRLPIKLAPTIILGNALRLDWADVLAPSEHVVVVGNPPFIGQYTKTAEQTEDAKSVWGGRWSGYLDYVTCWYAKTIDYYGGLKGRWAFVSTNSICQGEATEPLWRAIFEAGWRCRFAHRSFRWTTEAASGAAVHVSIVGFDRSDRPNAVLWTYGEDGQGSGTRYVARRINAYLIPDAPMALVTGRARPPGWLPEVTYGNKPTDDGNFFLDDEARMQAEGDPGAAPFVRRFVGARELLHNIDRWCLWLVGTSEAQRMSSDLVSARVEAVRSFRRESRKAATQRKALTPWLFDEVRQPDVRYLAIPAHVGQDRPFFTPASFAPEVICGNANFMAEDPDGLVFALLSSTMFIQWMRAIGGRIKSDLRFSNTFTFNTFPMPVVSEKQRKELILAAAEILRVRALYSWVPLADLYSAGAMPPDLVAAHDQVDAVIDRAFQVPNGATPEDRSRILLRRYASMTNQEDPALF